eukprot:CAMPEP_0202726616 /NCGR_PEP_ID=MMETSP1385-20130828/184703_1 /ASSEMBLY_ACC=CAM_ASM_000861 /TAXON_ID=933848 /ORGANISM="Elphidium margaritaceum" /LENGTH=768 /DNA_ID=CAMNT_0049392839 /DNA_START=48 /DNA_END=2354 /DNA_ORIENTATION=+
MTTTTSTTRTTQSKAYVKKPRLSNTATIWITERSPKAFKEDYTLIKKLGEPGQFGVAYRCRRNSDHRLFAVKKMSKARIYRADPSSAARQHLLRSMQAEIDILRRLHHPYICQYIATYETKHNLRIVMEECQGGELFERIKARQFYDESDARPILRMICEALCYMLDKHRVVHCDLKPENILFVDQSETSAIKIIDFGMSKVLPRLRLLNGICGTPYYTAPEVLSGNYGHAADMWSVGVIAFVMIFGFPPFYVGDKYYGINETRQIYRLIQRGFTPQFKHGFGAFFPLSMQYRLGADGMDFIANLLQQDVQTRMTAKEALQHPFLHSSKTKTNAAVTPTASPTTDSDTAHFSSSSIDLQALQIMNFATSHKFKYAISALFRSHYEQMRPKHFANLKSMFAALDQDGNGKISYEEFEKGMLQCAELLKLDRTKIAQMFQELDVDKCGEIDFDNLLNAAVHDFLVASDERLYAAFVELDTNESGHIQTGALKQKLRELNPYDNVDALLHIVDDVDLDQSGTINYEEFLRALHPDFNETPNWFPRSSGGGNSNSSSSSSSSGRQLSKVLSQSESDLISDIEPNDDSKRDKESCGGNSNSSSSSSSSSSGRQLSKVLSQSESDLISDIEPNDDSKRDKESSYSALPRMPMISDTTASASAAHASTSMDNSKNDILKKGYLTKEGGIIKTWRRRFFVLHSDGMMSYFTDQRAEQPIARFNCKTLTQVKEKSWGRRKLYGIKIYTPHRDWKVTCISEQQRSEWVASLKRVSGKN